jgi:hypothetical protein
LVAAEAIKNMLQDGIPKINEGKIKNPFYYNYNQYF